MRKVFSLLIIFLIVTTIVFNTYLSNHIYPNTYLGSLNLAGHSKEQVLRLLAQVQKVPVRVKVKDRVYSYSLSELGIIFDLNTTVTQLFHDNQGSFFKRLSTYYHDTRTQQMVQPALVFTQKFYEQFQNTVFDFSIKPDEVLVDQNSKQLIFASNQEKYTLNSKFLEQTIRTQFGENELIIAQIQRIVDDHNPVTIEEYNKNLGRITALPVTVSLPTIDTPITLAPTDLQKLLLVSYDNNKQQLGIDVNQKMLTNLAQSQVSQLLQRTDMAVDSVALKKSLVSLATSRFNNIDTSFIQGTLVQIPQSHGEIAQKYIEIDIRQQTMYLWEGGNNIATHRVSTGLYYPTPPGTYHILNKAPNAYSDIYHVWMPYWMAFYLDPKVNAYLGIHELPYWVTGDGQEIRRPRNFIGSPHTGGCVSLDLGEAKLVYDWAEVGMPVIVYE